MVPSLKNTSLLRLIKLVKGVDNYFHSVSLLFNQSCNLGQTICRLFHILPQFFFTASETELYYYYQKISAQVASRVTERLET